MKKNWKRQIAVIAAAAMLAGCGNSQADTSDNVQGSAAADTEAASSEDTVTIRFAGWLEVEDATAQLFKNLIDGFEAENPNIKVETVAIPFNNFKDQIMIAANSGDVADVIMGNNAMMSAFNGASILEPLEGVLDQFVIDDLIPVYKESTMYNGKLTSVCWMPHPIAMFYNKELFEKAGIDPETPPATWAEMETAIEKISALGQDEGGNQIYGLAIPDGKEGFAAQRLLAIVKSYGGDLLDDEGAPALESEAWKKTFRFMKDMAEKGYMPECIDSKEARSLFATGVAGITFESEMGRGIYRNTSGIGEAFDEKMGVALMPVNETGEATSINTRHELGIYTGSEHKAEAAKLIEYLLDKEAAVMYHDSQDAMSPRTSISELPEMNTSEYDEVFNKQSQTAEPIMITNTMFDNAMTEITKGLERVLVNHEEVDTVLSELQTTVTELYAKGK